MRRAMRGALVRTTIAALIMTACAGVAGPAAAADPARGTSSASAPVAGTYVPLVRAARTLDTRSRIGAGAPAAHGTIGWPVVGHGGVPSTGVSAVAYTLTVASPAARGYVTAYKYGATRPGTANINFFAGRTISVSAVGAVGTGGRIALYNGAGKAVQLVADVSGYYRSGTPSQPGSYVPVTPARALDTRTARGAAAPAARSTVDWHVAGHGGVPSSGVSAVVVDLSVLSPRSGGYLTTFAGGTSRPTTSSLSFLPGETSTGLVVAQVGTNGAMSLFDGSSSGIELVGDVQGYYLSGTPTATGAFVPIAPARTLDMRNGVGEADGLRDTAIWQATGAGGVPKAGVSAVVANLTVPTPRAGDGYVDAYADGFVRPSATSVSVHLYRTVNNTVIVPVGASGKVALYFGRAPVYYYPIGDVAGYYLGAPHAAIGAVSGKVVGVHGAALRGVQVYVVDPYRTTISSLATGTTDRTGKYTVARVPGSTAGLFVCFDARAAAGGTAPGGYGDECYDNHTWSGDLDDVSNANRVSVLSGRTHTAIDATLPAFAVIGGTVTAAGGAALAHVTVSAFPETGDGLFGYPNSATTANDGSYRLTGLAPGRRYAVCFDPAAAQGGSSPAGYLGQCHSGRYWAGGTGTVPSGATEVTVPAGTVRQVSATLPAAAGLAGRVTGSTGGAGLNGVQVNVYDTHGAYRSSVTTNADGDYLVPRLAAGSYQVCFDPESANARDTSRPGFLAQCYQDQAWARATPPTGSPSVDVVQGTVHSGVDQALPDAGSISGIVTDDASGLGLSDTEVEAFDAAGQWVATAFTAYGDAAGRYQLNGLPPSSSGYTVCFTNSEATRAVPTGYVGQCSAGTYWRGYDGLPTAGTTPVTVAGGGDHGGVDAALDPAGGVQGTVTDASSGNGLYGVLVTLFDSAGTQVSRSSTTGNGTYQLRGLPASSSGYRVCFSAPGYHAQCYHGQAWSGAATDLPAGAEAVPVGARSFAGPLGAALVPA